MKQLLFALALLLPGQLWAWEEQKVVDFIMVYNPLLRAYRNAVAEDKPAFSTMQRIFESTSVYSRAGSTSMDFREQDLMLQAGVQISLPMGSTRERQQFATKAAEEIRAIDEIRGKVLSDIAVLRQYEADLKFSETRLEFYEKKSMWLQERVNQGHEDATELWNMDQQLNEARATVERLMALYSSHRYQVAHYAGDHWGELLEYLQGNAGLQSTADHLVFRLD
jgi:hypothetical protein